ncbi:amidohydrolase family protein [Amycolatopsis pigmentata]|uniref:Amidohydrolase family protein n=1 Tax=Amycolatopsis pigmentata TaxID=450801 RepID=A0ABW5FQW7_9PSEU
MSTITIQVPNRVFDVHQHVGTVVINAEDSGPADAVSSDADRRREIMHSFGMTQAALAPSLQYERPEGWRDTVRLNDAVASYARDAPADFPVTFGTTDLLSGTANCLAEIDRLAGELGMAGVMWHHRYQGMFLDDRRMHPLLDRAGERGLVVAVHLFADSAMEAPDALERLASAHPGLTLLTLDAFTAFAQIKALLSILERHPNIVLDTAGVFPLGRAIDQVVAAIGHERLVFGSDMYARPKMWNYPAGLLEVCTSDELNDAQREAILYGNAARLFSLDAG